MLLGILRKFRAFNGLAVLAAGALLLVVAPPTPAHAAGALTSQEQQQAATLAKQLVLLINGMPATSTQSDYVSVIVGASVGVSCPIAKSALALVAATPGLPAAAVAAAKQVAAGCTGRSVGAITTSMTGGPDFSPGGGGANYQ
jgi:hypothetical protein